MRKLAINEGIFSDKSKRSVTVPVVTYFVRSCLMPGVSDEIRTVLSKPNIEKEKIVLQHLVI